MPSPKVTGSCSPEGTYLALFLLFVFFLILYVSYDNKEQFEECPAGYAKRGVVKRDGMLLDPDRAEVYQGIPIPSKYKPTKTDYSDPSNPPVDGDVNGLRSMYMFSYNKCAPECCKDSPYSCSGGCVCMTPKQYEFLDTRGDNREINGCHLEEPRL